MKNDNIFDRLSYLVDIVADNNVAKFARIINSGDQTIRSIIKYKRNYPSYELLLSILNSFEWLSAEWLITGKGEMKKINVNNSSGSGNERKENTSDIEDRLLSIIESQQRTIEYLSKKGDGIAAEARNTEARKTS